VIPRLVHITDEGRAAQGRSLADVVARAFAGGLQAVIVRERGLATGALSARLDALEPLRAQGLRVLVSRRLDLARSHGLDGVQLAADAVPVAQARAWLGPQVWIGYSAHSGAEARAAQEQGADYVTLSPIYATSSHPGAPARGPAWLGRELAELRIPALALGGITPERVPEVLAQGAWGVAAVSAIGAAADASAATRDFQRTIRESAP
jgi:thiamine-phosphate diphosphorylase